MADLPFGAASPDVRRLVEQAVWITERDVKSIRLVFVSAPHGDEPPGHRKTRWPAAGQRLWNRERARTLAARDRVALEVPVGIVGANDPNFSAAGQHLEELGAFDDKQPRTGGVIPDT